MMLPALSLTAVIVSTAPKPLALHVSQGYDQPSVWLFGTATPFFRTWNLSSTIGALGSTMFENTYCCCTALRLAAMSDITLLKALALQKSSWGWPLESYCGRPMM